MIDARISQLDASKLNRKQFELLRAIRVRGYADGDEEAQLLRAADEQHIPAE